MVIGELAMPIERNGTCRRMSLKGGRLPYRAVGAAAPFVKKMVGTPRRRGPKLQATQSPLGDAEAALPQKWDGGGAPSLPWRTSALSPRGFDAAGLERTITQATILGK